MTIAILNLTVDRDEYIAWSEGTLLSFKNGNGIVVNEMECEAADKALSIGEDVLLTSGSRLTGLKLVNRNNVICEESV